tara:strand:- start:6472 stop:7653 length:1182 start_codon:yes stop_codon:yes gene_type:complete
MAKKETVTEEGSFKMPSKRNKPKPKNLGKIDNISKVDLKPKEDAVQEQETKEPVLQSDAQDEQKREESKVELQEVGSTHEESKSSTEEVKEEVTVINEKPKEVLKKEQEVKDAVRDEQVLGRQLPENIEKLVKFMEDTGGTVEDYVTLNKDYTQFDDKLLVREYYKKTKPHLSDDEISFVMEDSFTYDEEVDEERFIKKQKLKYKEEVAKAKTFLEKMKSNYYDEIKLRPSVTNEQKKAMDFFNRYNKEQSHIQTRRDEFIQRTNNYFQEEFEGFNFEVGDKKFRYKVSNPTEMADRQSDVSKFISKFMDKDGKVTDLNGYHKAIYAARNADRLAQHFYEQGKADATREIVSQSKNINSEPRSSETGETLPNGWKVRAITGADSTKLKIKKRT